MNDVQRSESNTTLGNDAIVTFLSLGNTKVSGKVDTGATTSSLHAENIKTNNNSVSFSCAELSQNVITMQLDGAQEVVSADAGGQQRPIVKFDIEVNGVPLKGVSFNLNDRSEMDSPILIGQNILKAGNFVVDVSKESNEEDTSQESNPPINRDAEVLEAVRVLVVNNVTLMELVEYMRTKAVDSIKE